MVGQFVHPKTNFKPRNLNPKPWRDGAPIRAPQILIPRLETLIQIEIVHNKIYTLIPTQIVD